MNLPVEVISAVRQGRAVLFAGPRFAAEAAEEAGRPYPDDAQLAHDLGWRRPKRLMGSAVRDRGPVIPSVVEGARQFEAANGREGLVRHLAQALGTDDLQPTPAHQVALARFRRVFTTTHDSLFERAGGPSVAVRYRGDADLAAPKGGHLLYKLRGGFERPETLVLTRADLQAAALGDDLKKAMRQLVRQELIFFVGFKPDEEDFELLWADLTACYGGELPRCHMAVAQGRIDDYLWQKWVWRGLLLFTADPGECLLELDRRLEAGID